MYLYSTGQLFFKKSKKSYIISVHKISIAYTTEQLMLTVSIFLHFFYFSKYTNNYKIFIQFKKCKKKKKTHL
jgi:hypothetical protein